MMDTTTTTTRFISRLINKIFVMRSTKLLVLLVLRFTKLVFLLVRRFAINFLKKLLSVISINKSPIKSIRFSILIIILIITSIIIRIDYLFNILNKLPYEAELIIRICSCVYTIFSIFLLIIALKYSILLSRHYLNNKNMVDNVKLNNSSYYLYILYILYIIFANIVLYILNYYSIISLNLLYLELSFYALCFISLIYGIYYSINKHDCKLDLNKSLSLPGMICFISLLTLYIAFFIGFKFNLFTEYLIKWDSLGIVNKVYCEGSSGDTSGGSNNFNSKLKSPDEGKISSAPQESSKSYFSSSTNINNNIVATDNSTISNVNINPGQSSAERTPHVNAEHYYK